MSKQQEVVLVLHNIRSSHNVGVIFRTAEAAGVVKIYLVGYTPAPIDRFTRPNKKIGKTALGAEKNVFWERRRNFLPLARELKKQGYQLVALEQANNSLVYNRVRAVGPTAVILGNEVRGLSRAVLRQSDFVAEIPMAGRKESLNVAVACGVFLFHLRS